MIYKFETFINEAKVNKNSTLFAGKPSVSTHIRTRDNVVEFWINGGNAFYVDVNKDQINKMDLLSTSKGNQLDEFNEFLMNNVSKAIENSVETFLKKVNIVDLIKNQYQRYKDFRIENNKEISLEEWKTYMLEMYPWAKKEIDKIAKDNNKDWNFDTSEQGFD